MTGRLLRSKRRRKPKRFFRRAPRFRRGRSIAIRRLFYFSDSVPIRFGDFRAFASERAMSGGEAACARFPVEHSWFLNRARRRLWAREWLSPLQDVGRIEKFGDGDGARSAAGIAHGARTSGARARKGHPPLWVRGQAPVQGADLRGGSAPTSDRSGASDRRLRGAHFIHHSFSNDATGVERRRRRGARARLERQRARSEARGRPDRGSRDASRSCG